MKPRGAADRRLALLAPLPQTASAEQEKGECNDGATQIGLLP